MKIGVSTFVLQGGKTGVSAYIRNLLCALQAEDRENSYELLMAANDARLVPLTNPKFRAQTYPSFVNQPVLNLALHNAGFPQKKYDVLHIPSYRRIPLLKRTKIVATVHDLAAFSVADKYDRARMLFNRRLVPSMIRRADHVIAASEYTKNDLMRWIGYPEDQISVIYSGIDHARFRPLPAEEARAKLAKRLGQEQPFFVYVSRLEHPAKNHVRLIEAFERFKLENDSRQQLVFAGADWHGADVIRARAAESPVKDDIRFAGFVEADIVPMLYSACDLMIFPSLFEGFGFPIIEAMACGAPVICSNTSSMKELAGERIATFDPYDTRDIFKGMETAVARGRDARRAADNMAYAETFDWQTTARRVMDVYQTMS